MILFFDFNIYEPHTEVTALSSYLCFYLERLRIYVVYNLNTTFKCFACCSRIENVSIEALFMLETVLFSSNEERMVQYGISTPNLLSFAPFFFFFYDFYHLNDVRCLKRMTMDSIDLYGDQCRTEIEFRIYRKPKYSSYSM